MEEIGDDFGDLYADFEAQVTSSIDGVQDFAKLYSEHEDNTTKKSNPEEDFVSDSNNLGSIGVELTRSGDNGLAQKTSGLEVNGEKGEEGMIVDNGSESEDDLNIVLNDEDCRVFPASARNGGVVGVDGDDDEEDDFIVVADGNGSGKNRSDGLEQSSSGNGDERGNGVKGSYHSQFSQYKYVRSHAATFPSNVKRNGSAGAASSMFARGDQEDNEWNQYKGSTSGQVAPIHAAAIPAKSQGGYGFLLPRYRTILDVNIDTFEQKPWRHPGVDITDFFNYGFDEQSWKDYCNSVEQFRQKTSMLTRIPVHEFSKYNQACEAGSEREKVVQEAVAEETDQAGQGRTDSHACKIAARGVRQLELPKGRAIQVEGSIGERQPSMDVRRPRIRDTDVVIQITVQDSVEDSSGSSEEDLGHRDSTICEASENGDFGADDNRDIHCLHSASGDELSSESLEEIVRRLDRPSALKRCSQPTAPSNPMSVDLDNHRNGQNSDVDEHHHEKVDAHTSEGNAEAMETQDKTEEGDRKNTCNADPCIMETESSLGDRIQHILSSSSFGSFSEASEDDVSIDSEKIQKPLRKASVNSATELQDSEDSKSNGIKLKPGYCKDSVRNRSPIRERWMCCSRKLHSVAESKIHTYDNEGASTISDTDVLYDNDHSSVGRHRRKERLHGYGFYDREDISYYRETELCSNFRDERFADNHVQTAYTKNYRRKGHRSSRDEIYPYPTRNQDEREYIFEQKITRVENEILERDWYHRERGVTIEDMDPLTYRESRRSKYSSYTDKEEETQWRRRRRSDKHYFRKRSDNGEGDPLLECEHGDDFLGEKYRRSIPSIGREKDSLEEKYEKRLQCADRKMENSGRRERYSERPILDMDYSWSTGIQDDHQRHMDHQFLSSRSHGEPHSGDGGRCHDTMSPRDDVYDLRSSERYGRRRTQIYSERWRDRDTFGRYNDANYTENSIVYPDGGVHFGRRRYSWQSREMHWTEDELISRHPDDELYNEEESFSHEKISRHERMRAKHGSAHGRMLIDDKQSKRHRHRMIREGSSGNVINRSSDSIHRCTHEQTVPRCRDSVDMVVGDGKSSGRCTKAASIMCNGRLESLNSKIDEERMTSEDFNQSYRGMAVQPGIPKIGSNQNNEKWHHKFPITEHNEALDLEEGQIVPDEPDKGVPIEKKHVSESEALTGDVKKIKLQNKNAANGNTVSGGYDNHRILETLAKMEKRGERFKEPLTLKKEPDKNPNSQVDPIVETTETKQQRPVRKRRWVGS